MAITFDTVRPLLPGVLRAWSRADFDVEPWAGVVYLTERLRSDPAVATLELRRKAVKLMLERALGRLAKQDARAESVLREYYFRSRQGRRLSRDELRLQGRASTEHRVKYALDQALDVLARELTRMEERACHERLARIGARLDAEPPELFGQAEVQETVLAALREPRGRRVVSVEGLGGSGKTSLAGAVARRLAAGGEFADIFWISARQTYFHPEGVRSDPRRVEALTGEQLTAELAALLELDLAEAADPQAVARRVTLQLKARPYLVVIDNLETVRDFEALIPELFRLAGPSKFLLTSRQSALGVQDVYPVKIGELEPEDLIRVVRSTAAAQGLAGLAEAPDHTLRPIYDVTGGNPLAAKLLVGLARGRELPELLAELGEARSRRADELFRFIYWQSWYALSEQAQALLLAMAPAGVTGARAGQLMAATEFDPPTLHEALDELARHSLVDLGGTTDARRYRIHRLTQVFIMHEVVKWPSREDAAR
jgi:hypothetical protein